MGRRITRNLRPRVEQVEPRELMSLVTNILMANRQSAIASLRARSASAFAARGGSGFVPSRTSIAVPENQGPQGTNLAIAPTGKFTTQQVKRQLFNAVFKGTYSIGPGRTDTEAMQVFIRGAGTASSMIHSDIQIQLIVAKDPTVQNSGVTTIFDRNINSNSALGLDLASPRTDVDARGRPNRFVGLSLDPNISAGVYVEGFSQGVMDIHYIPGKGRSGKVLESGTAIVKIHAQIYAPRTSFILRNADINA